MENYEFPKIAELTKKAIEGLAEALPARTSEALTQYLEAHRALSNRVDAIDLADKWL